MKKFAIKIPLNLKILLMVTLFLSMSETQVVAMDPLQQQLGDLKNSLTQLKAKLEILSSKMTMLKNQLESSPEGMFGRFDGYTIQHISSLLRLKDIEQLQGTSKFFKQNIKMPSPFEVNGCETELIKFSNNPEESANIKITGKSLLLERPSDMGDLPYIIFTRINGRGPLGLYEQLTIKDDLNIEKFEDYCEKYFGCSWGGMYQFVFGEELFLKQSGYKFDKTLKEVNFIGGPLLYWMKFCNLRALEKINLSNCENLNSLRIEDCPKVKELDLAGCPNLNLLYLKNTIQLSDENIKNRPQKLKIKRN